MIPAEFLGIDILLILQDVRNSIPEWFNQLMEAISDSFFISYMAIILFAVIFWVVDKKRASIVCMSVSLAMVIFTVLKPVIKQPRPWDVDSRVNPYVSESGHAFPSGHSAIATSAYGSTAYVLRKWYVTIIAAAIIGLILFSRLWLGHHTPLDLIAGMIIGLATIFLSGYLVKRFYDDDRKYFMMLFSMLAFIIVLCLIGYLVSDFDAVYSFRFAGIPICFVIFSVLDRKFIEHDVSAVKGAMKKMIIAVIGLAVLAVLIPITSILPLDSDMCYIIFTFAGMFWAMVLYPLIIKKIAPLLN